MFYYVIVLPLALFLLAYKLFFTSKPQRFNLPPSPPYSLPILGHHHLLKPPVHRLFHRLSKTHGPIFSLQFGSRRAVVISSSSLATQCFTGQNDIILSNRPCFLTAKYVAYNYTTVGTAPYGDHWRNLRRICSLEILSSNRLTNFLHIRKDEIRRMLTRLSRDVNKEIELEPLLSDLTFNNIVRMVTGKRYYGDEVHNEEEANVFKKLVADINDCSGARHPGDYLPFMKMFGGSLEKKVKALAESMDEILQRLLEECRRDKDGNTMVNHLLSLQQHEPEYYTDVTIKGLMLVYFTLFHFGHRRFDLRLVVVPNWYPYGMVYNLHRDPELWNEPEKFKPERFNGGEDVHKLMPFGNGRRSCPGAGLGQKIVTLALGSLIQCFDWEKVNGKAIDMTETPGMAMRKKVPLWALCQSRPIMNKLQAH
ncbi:unnamed protein product [Arabidopsis arenosa]|uniref:Cytochrome P450 n=1 Tax=Arabidopsis arenosa TaxID=38785 RepID=A0A8S2AZ49_ARAAE|nr:unnamed protein product [Arabidopsis arenosa]